MRQRTRPVRPEEMCTTSPPAKSSAPMTSPTRLPSPAPHHMCQRRVHHDGPHGQKRAHRAELHASGHRARDDGRGDHAESHLEHDVDDAGVSCRAFEAPPARLGQHALHGAEKTKLVETAEEGDGPVAAVCERPSAHRPGDADDANDGEHHDHGVHHVFATAQTSVEERQAGRHQQDEHRAHDHETCRACIEHVIYLLALNRHTV